MQYREFGRTGVKVSALGFGGMRLPEIKVNDKSTVDMEESIRVIHRAFELGVNYIDTAPGYCGRLSETAIGKALKGWRDKVYVSTKNPEEKSGPLSREMLEKSLKNLDISYIDFYHMWGISWEDYEERLSVKDGPMDAVLKAKDEGLIKHLSFSTHDAPANIMKLIDTGCFESMLCQYNLLDRANEAPIAYAGEKGLGVSVMGPVGGGRLVAPSELFSSLLKGSSSNTPEAALRFVLANRNVSCALSGMNSIKMVEENAMTASNESPLSPEELELIKGTLLENEKLSELYCTGCNYCMPCPNDVNIPSNFQLMNYHRVYKMTDFAKDMYSQIGSERWITRAIDLSGKKADECIECGVCEEKCPQKIEIREWLKETAKALR